MPMSDDPEHPDWKKREPSEVLLISMAVSDMPSDGVLLLQGIQLNGQIWERDDPLAWMVAPSGYEFVLRREGRMVTISRRTEAKRVKPLPEQEFWRLESLIEAHFGEDLQKSLKDLIEPARPSNIGSNPNPRVQRTPDDGGSAFPTLETERFYPQSGMSLRDWFAGQALPIAIEHVRHAVNAKTVVIEHESDIVRFSADLSYQMADGMLRTRAEPSESR